jgi:hypothetical protein
MGMPKASVFPVPVFARAMRSRPSRAGINTALWRRQQMKQNAIRLSKINTHFEAKHELLGSVKKNMTRSMQLKVKVIYLAIFIDTGKFRQEHLPLAH